MTEPVEYFASPRSMPPRRWSKLAIACFIVGLVSGPLAVGIVYLLEMGQTGRLSVEATTIWCQSILLFPSVLALGLGIAGLMRIGRKGLRGKRLAVSGMIVSVLWIAAIYIFLVLALLQVGVASAPR